MIITMIQLARAIKISYSCRNIINVMEVNKYNICSYIALRNLSIQLSGNLGHFVENNQFIDYIFKSLKKKCD